MKLTPKRKDTWRQLTTCLYKDRTIQLLRELNNLPMQVFCLLIFSMLANFL